jgi:hypothetical protein
LRNANILGSQKESPQKNLKWLKRGWNAAETRFAPGKITFFSKRYANIGLPGVNPGTHHLTNRFRRLQNLAETGCSPSESEFMNQLNLSATNIGKRSLYC